MDQAIVHIDQRAPAKRAWRPWHALLTRKVQSIVEWTTQSSVVQRLTGLANYYRRFVEGYGEVAAQMTALGSPTAVCMVPSGAGKLRRTEAGPGLGANAAHV